MTDNDLWQDLDATPFRWNIPDRMNIAVACTDDQHPTNLALIVDTEDAVQRFTFGELASLSRRFTQFLLDQGVASGDRVGVMVPQGVEVVTAHLGSLRLGAVTVPLSVKFGPEAIQFRMRDSGAKVLVIDADNYARVGAELTDLPDLHTVVVVGAAPECLIDDTVTAPPISWSTAMQRTPWPDAAGTGPLSPAIIIYTSGTTGNPKGALHGHQILPAHMPGMRTTFQNAPQPGDVFWTPADWAWIGGLFDVLFTALALGCPVVASPGKFRAERAVDLMRRHNITATFIPPTALKQLRSSGVKQSDTHGISMRIIATGGEPLGTALRTWVDDTFGVPINEFYGQTEMNMTVGTVVDRWIPEPNSMGRAFPGFDLQVLDQSDQPVACGEIGEICVRAGNPGQFLHYWQQPERTAEKVTNGWIHTGDQGRMDRAGNIWFEGRVDDVISTAGYRVGPGEIEECLIAHPAVAMAAAVGAPDELRGEAIHAFVVLTDGYSETAELAAELQHHVKSRLAFYQYPRRIIFAAELPLTTTGKILRRELRATLLCSSSDTAS